VKMSKIDDLARSLADRTSPAGNSDRIRADADDLAFERIARMLATPISRRRAFRLAAAASFGASFFALRADRAYACRSCPTDPRGSIFPPEYTQFCGHPVGMEPACHYTCCLPAETCCQTEGAVLCCPPNTNCVTNPGPTCRCKPEKVCGVDPFTEQVGCCMPDEECFEPPGADVDEDLFCTPSCPQGSEQYQCLDDGFPTGHCCDAGNDEDCCGDGCCNEDGLCCSSGGEDLCCPREYDCTAIPGVCGCSQGQRCGEHCCGLGSVCCTINTGGTQLNVACCSATNLDELLDSLKRFFGVGTGPYYGTGAASRKGDAAAAAGVADALVAIDAVGDLARLAHAHIKSPPRDSAYRRAVRAPKVALRPVRSGPGLDAASAQALTKLLIAEARAWALIYAAAVARARSLTAIRAKKMAAARTQSRASAAFAARAARALRPIPRLRTAALAALRAGGAAEVSVTANQVRALQRTLARTGLPADFRARLSQLGLNAAERRRVAKLIVADKGGAHAANVLIEPLADAARQAAIRRMAKQLRRIAAASRRHPIRSSMPRPRTVPASRPHTSRAARHNIRRRG
jgi:hypothetical protein